MDTLKISHEKPPKNLYERCREAFNVDWDTGLIITYGDTAYTKYPFADEFKAHEAIHVEQQRKAGADFWWDLYFEDPKFRLSQEIEAYKAQIEFLAKYCNRHQRRAQKKYIIDCLLNIYGNICTRDEAERFLSEDMV